MLVGSEDRCHAGSIGCRCSLVSSEKVLELAHILKPRHLPTYEVSPQGVDFGLQGCHILLDGDLKLLKSPDLLPGEAQLLLKQQR